MAETVRDMIHAIQVEVRDSDLQPDRAAELLNRLTALLGNCNAEIREADLEYSLRLLAFLETEDKANRARIRAETTPEYSRKREARDTKELCIELARSMKYYLRAKEEEFKVIVR